MRRRTGVRHVTSCLTLNGFAAGKLSIHGLSIKIKVSQSADHQQLVLLSLEWKRPLTTNTTQHMGSKRPVSTQALKSGHPYVRLQDGLGCILERLWFRYRNKRVFSIKSNQLLLMDNIMNSGLWSRWKCCMLNAVWGGNVGTNCFMWFRFIACLKQEHKVTLLNWTRLAELWLSEQRLVLTAEPWKELCRIILDM